jgi:hypothetical protein
MSTKTKSILSIASLVFVMFIFLWKVFIKGYIAMPADLLVGAYFPWHEYKWGYVVNVPIKNSLISDSFSQFFVWKKIISDSYKNLELPLWNPYSYSGYPLMANFHSGALYFLNIVFLFFNFNFGWNLFIYLGFVLSAISMYLFMKSNGYSNRASIISAISYSLSGFSISWSQFATAGHSMIWIPVVLLLINLYFEKRNKNYLVLISIVFFVLNTVGHLQMSIYAYLLSSVYFLFKLHSKYEGNLKFVYLSLFYFVIINILSFGLSAVQLIPSFDMASNSVRFTDHYAEGEKFGLLPIRHIITLFAPDYFGNPATGNYYGFFNYHETVFYTGMLSVFGLIWAFFNFNKLKSIEKFFLFLLLGSSLFLFDNFVSRSIYIYNIPLLSTSTAGRVAGILTLALSVLAGAFVYNLPKLETKKVFKIVATLFLIMIAIFSLNLYFKNFNLSFNPTEPLQTEISHINISIRNLVFPMIIVISLSSFIFLSKYKYSYLFIILLLIIDLFRFGWKYLPIVDSKLSFPDIPIIDFVKSNIGNYRIEKEWGPLFPPNTWSYYGLMSPSGYDPMAQLNYTKYFFEKINGNKNISSRYSEIKEYDCDILGGFSVKYLMAIKRDDKGVPPGDNIYYKIDKDCWKTAYETEYVTVLENTKVKDIFEIVGNENSKLIIVQNKAGSYELEYDVKEDSTLIIRNSWDGGWKAKINGERVNIEKYNDIFQSLKLLKGSGKISLIYYPDSFDLGLKISIISLFILIIIYILDKRK